MTESLPDPRFFTAAGNALSSAAGPDSGEDSGEKLAAALGAALAAGDDALIRAALHAGPPGAARRIWQALAAATDGGGEGVGLRLFAIPLLIVAGARTPCRLPGIIPEIEKVVALLQQHGAVGATRNFGLGNALSDLDALEALPPCALWRAAHDPAERTVADALVPAPVSVEPGREQVHLRFITGAGVTPHHLPSFLESASNIGTWGMPLTRELTRQLSQPGLEVLPMPRPPLLLAKAAYLGRCAQLDAALSLFLGNTVRRFRLSVGDPEAVLTAHGLDAGAGELRLSLSSPFDESMLEGFCWPLHPLDEIGEVVRDFQRALTDFRVDNVTLIGRVLPARLERDMMFVARRQAAALLPAN